MAWRFYQDIELFCGKYHSFMLATIRPQWAAPRMIVHIFGFWQTSSHFLFDSLSAEFLLLLCTAGLGWAFLFIVQRKWVLGRVHQQQTQRPRLKVLYGENFLGRKNKGVLGAGWGEIWWETEICYLKQERELKYLYYNHQSWLKAISGGHKGPGSLASFCAWSRGFFSGTVVGQRGLLLSVFSSPFFSLSPLFSSEEWADQAEFWFCFQASGLISQIVSIGLVWSFEGFFLLPPILFYS